MADAQMQLLGEVDGVRWYWAEPGRFSEPGVCYWNGTEHVRVSPAASPAAGGSLTDDEWQEIADELDAIILSRFKQAVDAKLEARLAATPPAAPAQAMTDSLRLDAIERHGLGIERDLEGEWNLVKHRRYGNPIRYDARTTLRRAIDAALAPQEGAAS